MAAFADDLAFGSDSFSVTIHALRIIQEFSRYSGLGLNIKKTTIVTSLDSAPENRRRLDRAGFEKLKIVEKVLGKTLEENLFQPVFPIR